jgi:hypothetical protein
MKATHQKTASVLSPLAACASIALLSAPASAGPPLFRSAPRTTPLSRIEVGVYSGPVYRQDYRYRRPGPPYCAPSFSSFYYPPPYYPPVYVAPPVYAAPPVYQGLPPPPSANYRLLAPSGSHLVAHVQEKLRAYAYYRGAVDGLIGAATRQAIRSYQIDRGIEVTGRIDQELLSDLGL